MPNLSLQTTPTRVFTSKPSGQGHSEGTMSALDAQSRTQNGLKIHKPGLQATSEDALVALGRSHRAAPQAPGVAGPSSEEGTFQSRSFLEQLTAPQQLEIGLGGKGACPEVRFPKTASCFTGAHTPYDR